MLQPAITPKFDWDTQKFRCAQCPLLGVKRTCSFALQMSAFDPKRTFGGPFPLQVRAATMPGPSLGGGQ